MNLNELPAVYQVVFRKRNVLPSTGRFIILSAAIGAALLFESA